MADLIDRDAVAYRVKSCITILADNEWDSGYNTAMAEAEQYIQNAPAVKLWISCSERLPELDTMVIVCYYGSDCIFPMQGETVTEAIARQNYEHEEKKNEDARRNKSTQPARSAHYRN